MVSLFFNIRKNRIRICFLVVLVVRVSYVQLYIIK